MKELPYFKFFPGEWIKGDVTLCSQESQGLFINICSFYWMKGCNMSLTGVQHRFNGCSNMLDELINIEVITVSDGKIVIDFLDEQFEQFKELSKKKSRAGKASAKTRKGNTRSTGVKQVVNKEDKIREDKEIDKEVYKAFAHLSISDIDFQKLIRVGYTKQQIDSILDSIENFKQNTKYKSLYLTAKKWLEKEPKTSTKKW